MSMNWVLASAVAAIPVVAQDMSILPTNVPPARLYYYVCTATNDAGLSDYSNEVTNTNAFVTLTWDVVTNSTGYFVYRGTNTGTYLTNWPATSPPFSIPRSASLTNRVVSFISNVTNWPTLTMTNPNGPFFVRWNYTKANKTYTVSSYAAYQITGPWQTWSWWSPWRTNGVPQVKIQTIQTVQ